MTSSVLSQELREVVDDNAPTLRKVADMVKVRARAEHTSFDVEAATTNSCAWGKP